MKKSPFHVLVDQFRKVHPVATADLTGKTVIVIGANTGIGYQAAKHFALMNPGRLILGCRSHTRGKEALDKLRSETANGNIELSIIDLSTFESTNDFATRFLQDPEARLDILVMNAAVNAQTYNKSTEGWESTLQINNLSTSLLSLLLAPRLIETAAKFNVVPRLVLVSSEVHYWSEVPKAILDKPSMLEALSDEAYCMSGGMKGRYELSKLFNIMFTRALASRMPTVVVTTPNPGLCTTELRRDMKGLMVLLEHTIVKWVAFTAEEGSRSLVWAALAGSGASLQQQITLSGGYVNRAKIDEPSDYVLSGAGQTVQERLWNETIDILSKVDLRISKI